MDLYSFAPIAAVLDLAYAGVTALIALLSPLAGPAAAALAVVLLTLVVRAALIPVGVSQVRAEYTRRRLAPKLEALRKRYAKRPEVLQQKMLELYRTEKASPFAGMLPALAQAPVVSIVYGLFILQVVNGHANGLLDHDLLGVSLGTTLVALVGGGDAWPGILVYAVLLALIGVVAWFSRRASLRFAPPAAVDASNPGAAAAQSLGRWLSWLPFITVVFAAIVPLAATLYLAVTTTWTLVERQVLRERLKPVEE